MVRYSFFIFTAVFCDYSVQSTIFNADGSSRDNFVYADESSDINSDNSVVDSSDNPVNSISEVDVGKTREIINNEIVDEIQENEIYSTEENQRNLIQSRAFPSHNWSFSYQTDWKNVPDQYSSFLSYFKGLFLANVNNFMDHAATRIIELGYQQDDILRKLNADNLYILNEKNVQIAAVYAKLDNDNKVLGGRIDSLSSTLKNSIGAEGARLDKRINDLSIRTDGVVSSVTTVNNAVNKRINDLSNRTDNINADVNKRIDNLSNRTDNINVDTNKRIDTLSNKVDNINADVNKRINDLSIRSDNMTATINNNDKAVNTRIDNLSGRVDSVSSDLSKLAFKLDADNLILGARIDMTNSKVNSIESKVDNLEKALLAALTLMNLKLDTNNEKLGLIYDRLGAYFDRDGIFTIAIREQFTRLLDAQETIFWTDGKTEDNEKDGSFVKLLKALIYSIRYGLIAEFSDFTKVFREEMKTSRDNFNKYIELVNQNLNTSIGWLKLIYEKQINVVIPPITIPPSQLFVFDYDRLQKMFDGISFGDITNEAGKNIWDFLGELVKALADVVSTLAGLVGDILKMLTEALVPSDVSFISDELSKISSLFTKKFSFAIELKDFFTSMFEIAQVDFNTNLEFSANGKSKAYDISFIMPFISAFRAPLTALIVISNLFYCYKRVIGQGDVIA